MLILYVINISIYLLCAFHCHCHSCSSSSGLSLRPHQFQMICNIVTNVTNFGIMTVGSSPFIWFSCVEMILRSQVSGSLSSEPDRVILDLGLASF